jgi:hypothetical protein
MSDDEMARLLPNLEADLALGDMRRVLARLIEITPPTYRKIVARGADRVFDEALRRYLPSVGVPQGLREEAGWEGYCERKGKRE